MRPNNTSVDFNNVEVVRRLVWREPIVGGKTKLMTSNHATSKSPHFIREPGVALCKAIKTARDIVLDVKKEPNNPCITHHECYVGTHDILFVIVIKITKKGIFYKTK